MTSDFKHFNEFIKLAESSGKKNVKTAALLSIKNDAVAIDAIKYALSPFQQFNVKKYVMPSCEYVTHDAPAKVFFDLLYKLENRIITGNAARDAVTEVLGMYTAETAANLARILAKDLACGISITTVNNVLGENTVYSYSCMLADKCEDINTIKFPVIASIKMDGQRVNTFVKNKEIDNGLIGVNDSLQELHLSRSGKEAVFCNSLFIDDLDNLYSVIKKDYTLDSEAMAATFTDTMNAKKRGSSKSKDNLRLYAFDFMSLEEWNAKKSKYTQRNRYEQLCEYIDKANCKKIIPVEEKIIFNVEELLEYYKDVIARGYEGLMIKTIDGEYVWDRSSNWQKLKPFFTVDGVITAVKLGTKRLSDTMGAIEVEGVDEKGRKFVASVGSGFTDEDRPWFLKHADELIAKRTVVEIQTQELTKSANSDVYSLRFPVFLKIRFDKEV